MKEPVLIYYEPRYSTLIGKLQEKLIILDYIDDKLAFSNVPRWMKTYLDNLIKQSNLIFVASSYLHNNILKIRKNNVHLIGNGVDINHFRKAMADITIPDDITQIKPPIVGYIGALTDWVDFEIIRAISQKYPDLSIVLIGPEFQSVKSEIDSLKQNSNIFVLGARPYESLPNYLKAFEVCIIPFKINELTLSSNPIKLHEYLAAGKKVISINLPEVKPFDRVIHVADNLDEFLRFVPISLKEQVNIEEFTRITEENTWDRKTEKMVEIIIQRLAK